MEQLGYSLRGQLLRNVDCGGAVAQDRMIVFAFHTPKIPASYASEWNLPLPPLLPPRPMTNCLQGPFGAGPVETAPPGKSIDQASICIPDSRSAPMPSRAGDWIHVPTGYRRLFSDKFAHSLGVPSSWAAKGKRPSCSRLVNVTTSVHIVETLGLSIVEFWIRFGRQLATPSSDPAPALPPESTPETKTHSVRFETTCGVWTWAPLDMAPGSPWHSTRLRNLKRAIGSLPKKGRSQAKRDGVKALLGTLSLLAGCG